MRDLKRLGFESICFHRLLDLHGLTHLDPEEVSQIKKGVEHKELVVKQARLRKENPISFLLSRMFPVTFLVLTFFLYFLFSPVRPVIGTIAFFVLIMYLPIFRLQYGFKTHWEEDLFSPLYETEYKGTTASRLVMLIEKNYLKKPKLTVEHHPYSKLRFLLLEDPIEGGQYYLDYWEKPEGVLHVTPLIVDMINQKSN